MGRLRPAMANTIATMMPTTKRIHAMFVAVPAMPENPSAPATSARIKKMNAQPIVR